MDDEKVCTLPQVRGGEGRGDEPGEVEVWRDGKSGRLVMRAYNQGGHDCAELGSPGFQRTTMMGCLSTGWHQVPGYRLTGGAFLRHHPSAKKNEPAQ